MQHFYLTLPVRSPYTGLDDGCCDVITYKRPESLRVLAVLSGPDPYKMHCHGKYAMLFILTTRREIV